MTDEQYIEKLINKDFDQRQINQLLKIYVYTKEYELDLSKIDKDIDEEILRDIANKFKKGVFDKRYINLLKKYIDLNLDIVPYLINKYDYYVVDLLLSSENNGFDVSYFKDPHYSFQQIKTLISLSKEFELDDLMLLCNPLYEPKKMIIVSEGLKENINLFEYIDITKFNIEQVNTILDCLLYNKENDKDIDFKILMNPEFSFFRMQIIESILKYHPDINKDDFNIFLDTKFNDNLIKVIYKAVQNNIDIKFLKNEKLSEKQANMIHEIMFDYKYNFDETKFDYTKIFNENIPYPCMNVYQNLICNKDIELLNDLLEKNYSYEKLVNIIKAHKEGLDVKLLESINDFKDVHFTRRMMLLAIEGIDTNKYINNTIDFNEKIKMFKEQFCEKIIEAEKNEEKEPKNDTFYINNYRYFLTNDNHIVEISLDTDYSFDEEFFGEISEKKADYDDYMSDNNDKLYKMVKNFFTLKYDEISDSICVFDILKNKIIESDIDHWAEYIIEDFIFIENDFYDSFYESIEEEINEVSCNFISPFSEPEEMIEYGAPNVHNQTFVTNIKEYYEEYIYQVKAEDIKKEFGDLSIDSIKKARSLFEATAEYIDDCLNGNVYYYREYNLDGKEIDSCYGFTGKFAIDDIESNTGNFIKELGDFDCIEDCINDYIQDKEEER